MFMDELDKIDAATSVDSNFSKIARRNGTSRYSNYMYKTEVDLENPTRNTRHVTDTLGDSVRSKRERGKTASEP